MSLANSLPQRLQEAFAHTPIPTGIRLFVVRRDGLMVWEKTRGPQSQALAALCGGVWEAAFAMAQAAGTTTEAKGFRLVFDESSSGVLIFPLTMGGQLYYMGGVYSNCVNPGRLRRQVQLLAEAIEARIGNESAPEVSESPEREGFLFTDISDAEMDRLFGA